MEFIPCTTNAERSKGTGLQRARGMKHPSGVFGEVTVGGGLLLAVGWNEEGKRILGQRVTHELKIL